MSEFRRAWLFTILFTAFTVCSASAADLFLPLVKDSGQTSAISSESTQIPETAEVMQGLSDLNIGDKISFLTSKGKLEGNVTYAEKDVNNMVARAGDLVGHVGQWRLVAGPNILFGVVEDLTDDTYYEVSGERSQSVYEVTNCRYSEHSIKKFQGEEIPNDAMIPPCDNDTESETESHISSWADEWDDDEVVELTIAVIFSPLSIEAVGSLEKANAIVAAGMALNNQAMQNSKINAKLVCVGTHLCDYKETGSSSGDLYNITDAKNGFEFIPNLRNQLGADFICFAPKDMESGIAGRGWLNNRQTGLPGYAFHVVDINYLNGLSWVHEWGHNMGCEHSYEQSENKGAYGGGLFGHSLGCFFYATNLALRCRSIMAYSSYWNGEYWYNWVPYFSDSFSEYGGSAVYYNPKTKNATTWQKVRKYASLYRSNGQPKLGVTGGGIDFIRETNSVKVNVHRFGEGSCDFNVSVEEGADWLSIKEADDSGTFSGTVSDFDPIVLNLDVNRDVLGFEYGRGKVKVTGNDKSTKILNVEAQGHIDKGYLFYANDFEKTELGPINKVDPIWLNSNAEIVADGTNRCMSVQGTGELHCEVNIPDKIYSDYYFRTRCRVKCVGKAFPQLTFGTDTKMDQGKYMLLCDGDFVKFKPLSINDPDIITNEAPMKTWFDLSYTYDANPNNRKLLTVTFAGSTYEINKKINTVSKGGYFNDFIISVDSDNNPYLFDDFHIEAIKKSALAPKISVSIPENPIPYYENSAKIVINNEGFTDFDFYVRVLEWANYLSIDRATNRVSNSFTLNANLDRSKMGLDFYQPVIRIIPFIDNQEPIDVRLAIQSGTSEEGYFLYKSDFDSLRYTSAGKNGTLIGELSEQDNCWERNSAYNRADIVPDPAGSGKKVANFVNCNDLSSNSGYQLNLRVPEGAANNYDVVYSMDVYIPKTYVDRPQSERSFATFSVSQNSDNHHCEAQFYLNGEESSLPVNIFLPDIKNSEWWDEHVSEAIAVPSDEWFPFYMRFNTKCINSLYKSLYALNFGENEYHMTGNDSKLTYPGGIDVSVLRNEALAKMELWSGCDNANICLNNVKILLVPKGLPEPSLLALICVLSLCYKRKL